MIKSDIVWTYPHTRFENMMKIVRTRKSNGYIRVMSGWNWNDTFGSIGVGCLPYVRAVRPHAILNWESMQLVTNNNIVTYACVYTARSTDYSYVLWKLLFIPAVLENAGRSSMSNRTSPDAPNRYGEITILSFVCTANLKINQRSAESVQDFASTVLYWMENLLLLHFNQCRAYVCKRSAYSYFSIWFMLQ